MYIVIHKHVHSSYKLLTVTSKPACDVCDGLWLTNLINLLFLFLYRPCSKVDVHSDVGIAMLALFKTFFLFIM